VIPAGAEEGLIFDGGFYPFHKKEEKIIFFPLDNNNFREKIIPKDTQKPVTVQNLDDLWTLCRANAKKLGDPTDIGSYLTLNNPYFEALIRATKEVRDAHLREIAEQQPKKDIDLIPPLELDDLHTKKFLELDDLHAKKFIPLLELDDLQTKKSPSLELDLENKKDPIFKKSLKDPKPTK